MSDRDILLLFPVIAVILILILGALETRFPEAEGLKRAGVKDIRGLIGVIGKQI